MSLLGKLNTKIVCYIKDWGSDFPVILPASLHIYSVQEEIAKSSGTMSLWRKICGNKKGRTSGLCNQA